MKKTKLLFLSVLLLPVIAGCGSRSKEYIGIVSAMDNEIALLLKEAEIEKTEAHGEIEYHIGTLRGQNVAICRSSIGKIRASSGVTALLDHYNIKKALFTGIAGGVRDEVQVLDEVIATRIVEHDYGRLTNNGFIWTAGDPGKGGDEGVYYECDAALVNLAYESAITVKGKEHVWKGTVATGDQFIESESYVTYLKEKHDAYACEMEGASVAVVCQNYGVPFVVLRALSDKADGLAHESYENFGDIAAEHSSRIVLKMLESL